MNLLKIKENQRLIVIEREYNQENISSVAHLHSMHSKHALRPFF